MSYPQRPFTEAVSLDCDRVEVRAENIYAFAGVYSFGRGLFERGNVAGTDTQYPHLYRLHAGSVVLSKLKAFEGAIAVIPDHFAGRYLSPEFPTFAVDTSQSDTRYLHHLCTWPQLWNRLAEQSTGIGSRRERVSPKQLLSTRVPLPELAEQRRVAAKLDAVMAKLDRISLLRAQLSKVRVGLLESLFMHLDSANARPMGELVSLERVPADLNEDAQYVQIGVRSFGRGIFHRPAVRPGELSKLTYFKILPGRLIVSNIMAWEGAVALSTSAEQDCIGSHRFLSFVPTALVDPAYLNYFFQTRQGRTLVSDNSSGTVKRNQTLSIRAFGRMIIPVPSIGRQRQMVRTLDLSSLHVERQARQQTADIATVRLSLLNAAFMGKL